MHGQQNIKKKTVDISSVVSELKYSDTEEISAASCMHYASNMYIVENVNAEYLLYGQ